MPNAAAFLSYIFVSTFTPGPNNIMSMSNASRYGFKKSIFFIRIIKLSILLWLYCWLIVLLHYFIKL